MKLCILDKKNLNVPNVLSLIRLLMVPVYLIFFAKGHKYAALLTFIAASLTDLLDGYLARKYNLITDLGKLLDPLADKLMVLTAMFSMALGNSVIKPVIPLSAVLIVLGKELLMMVGGVVLLRFNVVVHSLYIGKIAHCIFIAGLIASYFHDWFVERFPTWPLTPDLILVWIAVALTLVAIIVYAVYNIRTVRRQNMTPHQ